MSMKMHGFMIVSFTLHCQYLDLRTLSDPIQFWDEEERSCILVASGPIFIKVIPFFFIQIHASPNPANDHYRDKDSA
jgi:hypothetical protein